MNGAITAPLCKLCSCVQLTMKETRKLFCRTPFCLFVGNEKKKEGPLCNCIKRRMQDRDMDDKDKQHWRKHTLHDPGDRVLFPSLNMGKITNTRRDLSLVLLSCQVTLCLAHEIKVRVGLDNTNDGRTLENDGRTWENMMVKLNEYRRTRREDNGSTQLPLLGQQFALTYITRDVHERVRVFCEYLICLYV